METIIYYFTGTGNSLTVAKDLAEKLEPARLEPIAAQVKKSSLSLSGDRIGIVCPIYMWGLPLIVLEFIDKLTLRGSPYLFGALTYGGFPGSALKQLKKKLEQKGGKLSAGVCVAMPENYIPLFKVPGEMKQKDMFLKEKIQISALADIIKEGREGKIQSGFPLANEVCNLINVICKAKTYQMDKKFRVNEKCNSCEICKKVCPVDNIEMKEGKPQWLHHCIQCFACLHWCPRYKLGSGLLL